MTQFADSLRRIVTGNDRTERSIAIVDGGPSAQSGDPGTGGLFEIWQEALSGALDPQLSEDLGPGRALLSPESGNVKVRWFVVPPLNPDMSQEEAAAATRQRFADFGAADHLRDQSIHPAMHQTDTLDIICLLQGDVSLVLDTGETRMKPGQVVVQRGVSHAWRAHGGPALLLAVLIDRPVEKPADAPPQ